MGGNTARNALPSASLGNAAATTWLLPYCAPIRFHIGMKHSTRCSAPRKYMIVHLGLNVCWPGVTLPPRLPYHDSHGMLEQTSGVPRVSAWLATAFTVSGVEDANSRSTLSLWIARRAGVPARVPLDSLSYDLMLTL